LAKHRTVNFYALEKIGVRPRRDDSSLLRARLVLLVGVEDRVAESDERLLRLVLACEEWQGRERHGRHDDQVLLVTDEPFDRTDERIV
jgi:hypothetical protein